MSDVKRLIRKASQNLLLSLFLIVANTYPLQAADPYADGRTDSMSFWFDPDTSSGETFLQYFERKQYRYVYKEATVLDSTNSTYFMIHGQNADPNYPDFYGGVQQLYDGRKVAIFSAWDLGKSNCEYFSCKADDAEVKNRITLFAKGSRTTSQRSGGEGTFMQSFIYDLNWKVGQKISWLVSLEPAGADSLLSVAIKLEGQSWEFFASYLIPTRFKYGLAGGYGFIEDFGVNTPFIPRSMSIGPTIAETASGQWDVLTNVYIGSSKDKNRHKISVDGPSVLGQVGTEPQQDAKADYRVRLNSLSVIPDFSKGKAILDSVVQGRSTRYQEELKKLEDDAKAKAEIAAKAEAERITAEANAKAELEAKAKLEAIQRAEAEAKAKAEAEAKAAAELKAKQEAETKAKAVATKKKSTIKCVKGKLVKKVTAVSPKCPKGYKKR